ncbi:MAG: ABC transporter permease [Acetobacteraceae bacterium]
MLRFILRRSVLSLPSLFGLLVVTFILVRIAPHDTAAFLAGDAATPEQLAKLRAEAGLDEPIWRQFVDYTAKVARFDFGESAFSRRAVSTDIRERLPASLTLTFSALSISILVGVPLGVFAALRHNEWPDYALRLISVLGVAVAAFWFAIMLQLLFSMQLGWLPLRGDLSPTIARPERITGFLQLDCLLAGRWDTFVDAMRHLVLPAFTLSLGGLASIVRFTRAGVLDTLQNDFVFYERAMGYRRNRLVWRYVLRNSITATVTQIGLLFGGLIAGGVVVESIYDWPGIGSYTVQAILTGDHQVMLAVTLMVGVIYAAVNILTDLIHGLIDPRLLDRA